MLMFWSGRPQLRPLGLRRPTPISPFYPTIYSMRSSEDGKPDRNKKGHLRFAHKRPLIGGGGNRTRVPRYFHGGFYVRSRIISAFRLWVPNRQGSSRASRERCLASGVPSNDPRRFGISDRLLGLSDEDPQSGLPLVRRPKRSYLQQLKILVGF